MKSYNFHLPFKLVIGLFVMILIAGCKSQLQAQSPPSTSFIMGDGMVIDPARKQVFITNSENKVEAISITTGEILWSSPFIAKPLALANNRLICQEVSGISENTIVIIELNVDNKGYNMSSDSLTLPADVKANLKQGSNDSFLLQAKIVGNQTYFSWEYEQKVVRGLLETDSINNFSNQFIKKTGALRFNGTSRKLSSIQRSQLPKDFEINSIVASSGQRISNVEGQQFISADKKNVLISRKVADNGIFNNYLWEIYSLTSKIKIGQIHTYKSYAPFYVSGNMIIFKIGPYTRIVAGSLQEEAFQLVSIDFSSGSQLWSREIFDSIYRGPTPP